MLTGVCEKMITPKNSMLLSGFPNPNRYSNGCHDDLFAHCFYFFDGKTEVALVSLDLLCLPKWRVALMREKIYEIAGIMPHNCFISTTHTHSAPEARTSSGGSVGCFENGKFDASLETVPMYPEYFDRINLTVAEAVKKAKDSRFEAKIGAAKGYCGKEQNVGGNRHKEGGAADAGVYTISVKDINDNIRGVIVRYSLHPTFLGGENLLITSDYPGYIYECVKNKYPQAAVAFQIGTAGDQSSRFFRSGCTFEEAKRVGYAIGNEALKTLEGISYNDSPEINVYSTDVEPIKRDIPDYGTALEEYNNALAELEKSRLDGSSKGIIRSNECAVVGAKRMLAFAEVGRENVYSLNAHHPFEIYLLTIGDIAFVGIPTETFVKYGLEIQQKSPYKHTVVVTCANGYGRGYICTPESFSEGGYEALGSLYTGDNGDRIVKACLELLQKGKEKNK